MIYKLIASMIGVTIISLIISGMYHADLNERFDFAMRSRQYIEDYEYYFMAIYPEKTDEISSALIQGTEEAGKDFNIITDTYIAKNYSEQIKIIKMGMLSDVDGIILWPFNNNDYGDLISEIVDKGIPIVIASNDYPGTGRDSFIGITGDSIRTIGGHIVSTMKDKGTVLVVSSEIYDARSTQIQSILKFSSFKLDDFHVLSKTINNDTYVENVNEISEYVKNHRDLEAIVCSDSQLSKATINALQLINRTDIMTFGYENFENSEDYVGSHQIYEVYLEDAQYIGYHGLETLRDINLGEDVPIRKDCGISIQTIKKPE